MKTRLLFITFLLFFTISNAQNTAIPDPNFEQALIDLGYDIAPINGFVPTAQIDFISVLNIQNRNIEDLTGIEDFASLSVLECGNNGITSLNLSNNSILTQLNCEVNNLSYLNVKNGANSSFTSFKVFNNPNLTCIEVDDVAYSEANWASGIDPQMSFSEDCYTEIPDVNFEQALIGLGYDNVIDGLVLNTSINTVTSLSLVAQNISDLTGVEGFLSLSSLSVSLNQLTSIDLSGNTLLTILYLNNNQLASLDLSNNTNLIELHTAENQITNLNISNSSALEILRINNNQIAELDLSQNTSLIELYAQGNNLSLLNIKNNNNTNITYFNTLGNPNLECIEVDNITYSNTNWTNIDTQTSFSEDCDAIPLTFVPDNNFEQALIDLGYDLGPLDDYVPTETIEVVTNLNVGFENITDLTGIEGFTSLVILNCSDNQITTLDVSQNTALTLLNVSNNQLDALDVTQLSLLSALYAQNNQLTTLDLSLNTSLEDLILESNQLTSLNFKNGNNTIVNYISTLNNPNLDCIEVDDAAYSTLNWTFIDAQTFFSEDCSTIAYTYIPDDNFEQALIDLGFDAGSLDDYVPTANIISTTSLNVSSKNISALTGIEDFVSLISLNCATNQLTALDVSQNIALENLTVFDNQLTALDISQNTSLTNVLALNNQLETLDTNQNTALSTLVVNDNQLTALDLSQNSDITYLDANNNLLATLNIKNGNNTNVTYFNTTNNPNLICIEVDDANYSNSNWSLIDAQTTFSEDCSTLPLTYVPDDNFEQALIDLGYDTGLLDDYVPTANIEVVTSLDIDNKNIANLTGIEDFVALNELLCYNNLLTATDISQNTALTTLSVGNNLLETLDVSQNMMLTELFAGGNLLETLNISQNTALTIVSIGNNSLNTLDTSQNTVLNQLYINNNQLTSLNVRNGNNSNLSMFNATFNPNLECIQVDDVEYSTTSWTFIDAQTNFSEDCLLSVQDIDTVYIKIYPNPVSDVITVSSVIPINSIAIYDMLGKKVMSISNTNQINVSQLIAGVYFVKIKSNSGEITKKVIKN